MGEFPILRDLGFVLGGAALLLLAARPLRIPPILTYMIAGLLLGPVARVLTVSESVHLFSELGVALLLFVVGLELSLQKIRDIGRVAVLGGVAQVAATFGLGYGVALLFGLAGMPAAFVGLTAAFSSTVVVIKLLDRLGDLDALYGRLAIGVLLVQDVLVAVVLTLVTGAAGGEEAGLVSLALAFLGIAVLAAAGAAAVRWVLPAIFDWLGDSTEAVFVASLTWAFAFILAAESLHISVELGAFIGGVLLAQLPHNHDLQRRVHPLVDFFLAVFFVALGAQMEPASMVAAWPLALALSALVLLLKPAVTALFLRWLRQPLHDALRAGITLGQVSEFAFILVGVAIPAGLVGPEMLGLVALVGLITIGTSAVLVPRADGVIDALLRPTVSGGAGPAHPATEQEPGLANHVVVVGMNTLGRLLVERFAARGETVLAVDTDAGKLAGLSSSTLVGSAEDSRVLREAGVPRAKLVVSALQIEDVNSLLAYRCRRLGVPVSIHAFETSLADELVEMGADHVIISKYDGIRQMETAMRGLGVIR